MDEQPTNERDTHFAGFAKLLLQELMAKYDHLPPGQWGPAEKDELIITRRAYDLMHHACWMINNAQFKSGGVRLHPNAMMRAIEDLTEWPNDSAPEQ